MFNTCTNTEHESPALMTSWHGPALDLVLSYQNDAVIARYRKEFALSEEEAHLLFSDVKTYLWLAALEGVLAPPPKVDEGWHMFILFTLDYQRFCHLFFGRFLHHRPHRPDDQPDRGAAVRALIAAEKRHLHRTNGLSANWDFPGASGESPWGGTCSSDSVSCAPTPSCNSSLSNHNLSIVAG